MTTLSAEKAKEVLNDILNTLALPENAKKIDEIKETNGNEMIALMHFVFPIVMQIKMDTLKKHGLGERKESLVKFVVNLRTLEKEDPEVKRLHNLIRDYYHPPIIIGGMTDSSTEVNKTNSN